MDAHKLWMLRDFIGTNKVLFKIPVYQRNYDWAESNCDRLLDDIYDIINSERETFSWHDCLHGCKKWRIHSARIYYN